VTTAIEQKINGRTPAEWEELAKSYEASARVSDDRVQESWERSDTDGYMSQWASGLGAQLSRAKADWARANGTCEANILLTTKDEIASTHEKENQYGWFWILRDGATVTYGKRFFSGSKAQSWTKKALTNARNGFVIARVRVASPGPEFVGNNTASVSVHCPPDWRAMRDDRFEIIHRDWLMELARIHERH
jgi:hypothetical protein